jgi:hypothetical protein
MKEKGYGQIFKNACGCKYQKILNKNSGRFWVNFHGLVMSSGPRLLSTSMWLFTHRPWLATVTAHITSPSTIPRDTKPFSEELHRLPHIPLAQNSLLSLSCRSKRNGMADLDQF